MRSSSSDAQLHAAHLDGVLDAAEVVAAPCARPPPTSSSTGSAGRAARRSAAARTAARDRAAVLSCATVSSRCVVPGCPATNTGSPAAAPSQFERQVLGVAAGLPFSYARSSDMSRHQRGNWKLSGSPPNAAMALLGSERQAHVVVALVLVEPVLSALIERDGSRTPSGAPAFFAVVLAVRFERRERRCARAPRRQSSAGHRRRDAGGDVFGLHQHRDACALAAELLVAIAAHEAVGDEIALGGRVLGQAGLSAVVVGEDEPLGRDERAGAARFEADDRPLQAGRATVGES